ncbi:ATP-binding protein [Leisingera sp. D0M16]|uniref:ATP-binding protein n=1 Tax=Leisingera coralii TaxID=3351347 RepID=UPI003B7B8B0C
MRVILLVFKCAPRNSRHGKSCGQRQHPDTDRERIAALAQLDFIRRAEVVHFLGPPGTGKSQVSIARRV